MEGAFITGILKNVGEGGIFGLGWLAFLWAMMQLRYERTRYQNLVVHIIQYFTKVNMLRDMEGDSDNETIPGSGLAGLGRMFGSSSNGFEELIAPRGRGRGKKRARPPSREDSD